MKTPLIPHDVIQRVLDRHVHCASSPLSAVRQVIARLWPKPGSFHLLPRNQRRFAIASILHGHALNAAQYRNVMSGSNSSWEEVTNPYEFDMVTKEITVTNQARQEV